MAPAADPLVRAEEGEPSTRDSRAESDESGKTAETVGRIVGTGAPVPRSRFCKLRMRVRTQDGGGKIAQNRNYIYDKL
jgi:hypothetical protein